MFLITPIDSMFCLFNNEKKWKNKNNLIQTPIPHLDILDRIQLQIPRTNIHHLL